MRGSKSRHTKHDGRISDAPAAVTAQRPIQPWISRHATGASNATSRGAQISVCSWVFRIPEVSPVTFNFLRSGEFHRCRLSDNDSSFINRDLDGGRADILFTIQALVGAISVGRHHAPQVEYILDGKPKSRKRQLFCPLVVEAGGHGNTAGAMAVRQCADTLISMATFSFAQKVPDRMVPDSRVLIRWV